ncbi:MAG: restriction endonuclease subunit S [Actinomycetota bacterium]|nr:restriction endonuclease subunit S [Actinomycetota bacterium]MDA3028942.1 restriction endonuclease subunit S [Actinomycetota bacterium]
MSEWEKVKLEDLVRIKHGFAFKGEHFCVQPSRYSLVTPGNFAIGGGFLRTKKFYDGPVPQEYVLAPGDLLVTMTDLSKAGDTLGYSAVVPRDESTTYLHNQRVGLVEVLDPSIADPAFLQWVMRASAYRQEVLASATGTTVRHTSPGRIAAYEFHLPPLSEQRAIAAVLGALDDKIESNRRSISRLEDMFMLECAALMADAEPAGVQRLAELAHLSLGGTPSRANPAFWDGGEIPWINSGCLHERPVLTPADYVTQLGLERSATKLVPAGATVVAITGATLGVISRLGSPCAINQSVVAICSPDQPLNTYLYFWIRSNIAELVSSATGAAQQHVNKSNFEELRVALPPGRTLAAVHELRALLDQEVRLAKESRTLSQLRDALLPELLSGRLRVRDAEQVVSEAV